jgi:L-lactate permease
MNWQQLYDPFNNKLLSTAVSALPVLTLFFVLVGLKKRVWVAALSGLLMAVVLALAVFNMPVVLVTTAAGHGFIFGLLRIAWIVVGSIFLYNVASETGQFQVMKDSIAGLSSDKRLPSSCRVLQLISKVTRRPSSKPSLDTVSCWRAWSA